jgi:hypothetical protein
MSMLNIAKQIATTGSHTEKFIDVGVRDMSSNQVVLLLIILPSILIVYALLGSWLFNNFVCKALTIVKPITPLQFLGLYFAIKILLN